MRTNVVFVKLCWVFLYVLFAARGGIPTATICVVCYRESRTRVYKRILVLLSESAGTPFFCVGLYGFCASVTPYRQYNTAYVRTYVRIIIIVIRVQQLDLLHPLLLVGAVLRPRRTRRVSIVSERHRLAVCIQARARVLQRPFKAFTPPPPRTCVLRRRLGGDRAPREPLLPRIARFNDDIDK